VNETREKEVETTEILEIFFMRVFSSFHIFCPPFQNQVQESSNNSKTSILLVIQVNKELMFQKQDSNERKKVESRETTKS
jgi:hypothetical protein